MGLKPRLFGYNLHLSFNDWFSLCAKAPLRRYAKRGFITLHCSGPDYAGVLLGAEQLTWPDTATTIRLADGERLLTDGPFAETKEHLLGFYLLETGSLDVALDWAAKMPIMRYGTVEVRPVREGMRWQTVLE